MWSYIHIESVPLFVSNTAQPNLFMKNKMDLFEFLFFYTSRISKFEKKNNHDLNVSHRWIYIALLDLVHKNPK